MSVKEIIKSCIKIVIPIFAGIVGVMVIFALINGAEYLTLQSIGISALMAICTVLTTFVYYAKGEISRKSTWIRRVIQLALVLGIVLGLNTITFPGMWQQAGTIILLVLSVVILFSIANVVEWYTERKESEIMNNKLKAMFQDEEEENHTDNN